jgi:hypothetical protein
MGGSCWPYHSVAQTIELLATAVAPVILRENAS